MEQLLSTYLIKNKKCPIPGIGILSIEETRAVIDHPAKQLKPPSYQLKLEKGDAPLEDIRKYVAKARNCSDTEAASLLNDYSSRIQFLPAHGTMNFSGLGNFYRNAQGVLYFKDNVDAAPYYVPIGAEKIIRKNEEHVMLVGDQETTNAKMTEYYSGENPSTSKKWWIWALIILVASVALIAIHYFNWPGANVFGNHQPF